MLDHMSGFERTVVITALIVGVVVVIAQIADAFSSRRSQRFHFEAEMNAHARAHELELADREVAMWNALLEKPPPTVFAHRRQAPELVGRSQVLDKLTSMGMGSLRPGDQVIYGQGIGVAQQDMPMPTAEAGEEGPKTPPPFHHGPDTTSTHPAGEGMTGEDRAP
jgi:hypothetical protein